MTHSTQDPEAASGSCSSNIPPPFPPSHSRVSSFRSPQFEVLLYSPNVTTEPTSWATSRTIPVYGDHDVVSGKILVDSGPNCSPGRIFLTLTGAFTSKSGQQDAMKPGTRRHVFFFASKSMNLISLNPSQPNSPAGLFSGKRRKSCARTTELETRIFSFAFDLGHNERTGNILPSTFSSSGSTSIPVELAYQVTATWEPLQLTQKSSPLTIPIVIQHDPEFHSLNCRPEKQDSWIEIPLKSSRPVPVRCAVTLPSSLTFSRTSPIPYFVVFATTPRSPSLAREISTDATISISVSSDLSYREETAVAPTVSDSLVGERSVDSRSSRMKRRVIKRIKSATSFWSHSADMDSGDSGLPPSTRTQSGPPPLKPPLGERPGPLAFSDTQMVYKGISLGFPKRPRCGKLHDKANDHPSLEAYRALPDGLFKDKIPLNPDMLPSINWGGITLKYFFDVSVSLGQDELRARIPLRVT
ncbi:hypothetical protein GGX14DRAFT_701117 [Mycena pura]|uniref:Uncharacterized protein n=1 Tax=Mycena pura TaxID=153505 RepID=A0AAD6UTX8_9AGAR|nr:hypothetical protein GGX14DRAFT_701117 [Mycena pura]